jgi:hypothetical protein
MRYLIVILGFLLAACSQTEEINPDNTSTATKKEDFLSDFSDQKLLFEGKFQSSGNYKAGGDAKIYEAKDGKKTLVLVDFEVSNGPDLKVYLANDKATTNFVEISNNVKNGNIAYVLPQNVDLGKQKFVLIWCKRFSALFGFVELK